VVHIEKLKKYLQLIDDMFGLPFKTCDPRLLWKKGKGGRFP